MTGLKVKTASNSTPSSAPEPKAGSLGVQTNKSPIVVQKAFNRSDLINTLLEHAGIDKKQAVAVLDTLKDIMVAHLVPGGPQHFKWPELFTMKIKEKVATKARQGVNPFTGEPTTFSAKPAQRLVKIAALNGLKASIEEQC